MTSTTDRPGHAPSREGLVFSLRVALLAFGVCACSSAALFIKACETPAILIAAWRLLIASSVLQFAFWAARRRHPGIGMRRVLRVAWPAAALLAFHFWSWNVGVHGTLIAHASLIVNLTAPVMPVIVWVLLREHASRREWVGTAIAFCGAFVLAGLDFRFSPESFMGDVMCFVSMLAFALYLVWSRRSRVLPSIWLYIPPVYFLSGIMCLGAGLVMEKSILPVGASEWQNLLALGAIPTIAGHSILNYSMQKLPSQLVAVCNLGQFIPAAFMAWLFRGEDPTIQFAIATVLVVSGALVVIRGHAPAR